MRAVLAAPAAAGIGEGVLDLVAVGTFERVEVEDLAGEAPNVTSVTGPAAMPGKWVMAVVRSSTLGPVGGESGSIPASPLWHGSAKVFCTSTILMIQGSGHPR